MRSAAWTGRAAVIELLRTWFGDCAVEAARLDFDTFADCHRIGYRFRGQRAGTPFAIEQRVFFTHRDGQIDWIRLAARGFARPDQVV